VAAIDAAGLATGIDGGGTTITASFSGFSASAELEVTGTGEIPPDPSTVAPDVDPTVATTLFDATEFLYRLLHDEVERREAKRLMDRLRDARFEHGKSLEDFDFTFNPKVPKSQLIELSTCTFVDRKENVLLVGPCGVGKSHLAQAIGHRAVRRGHRVLFTTATQMFRDLRAGRGDGTYDRRMLKYTRPELSIVDDLGLRPLGRRSPRTCTTSSGTATSGGRSSSPRTATSRSGRRGSGTR
jgi:hypothetical protein